ncbi:MAG: hypothetical protein GX100_12790 [candidate division WS1 bacterium]|nr:hypothetical protein [candidate division WS1 bacterium]
MYHLHPTNLYLHEALHKDPDAMQRVERMLSALGKTLSDVTVYTEAEAPDLVRELQDWPPAEDLPGVPVQHRRPLIFTQQKIGAKAEDDLRVSSCDADSLRRDLAYVLGYIDPVQNYHGYDGDQARNMVCWPTHDFGTMTGCSHGCFYCGTGLRGKYLALGMNVAEITERVIGPTIEASSEQRCFRMIGWGADIISLEPEYGVFAAFLSKLAEYEERYGYFHSNSDNVDWIADVPHRDRLIGIWSLASEGMARQVEPGAPSAAARIEAMRKLNVMGVPFRVKLKPVVPLVGWQEDYAALIEQVLSRTRPETIGFCCLIWMPLEVLQERFAGLIDPEFMRAAEASADEMRDQTHSPFPYAMRAEMYRFLIAEVRKHDPHIPVFISTETREMWKELEPEIGQRATSFLCGCNPVQPPGPRLHTTEGVSGSTYFDPAVQ